MKEKSESSKNLSLFDLTKELLTIITMNAILTAEDKLIMGLVCQYFKEIADDNMVWENEINKRFGGLEYLNNTNQSYKMTFFTELKRSQSFGAFVETGDRKYDPIKFLNASASQLKNLDQVTDSLLAMENFLYRRNFYGQIYVIKFDLSKEVVEKLLQSDQFDKLSAHLISVYPTNYFSGKIKSSELMDLSFEQGQFTANQLHNFMNDL